MTNSLLKLTDFNTQVRLLLLHKAHDFYGEFCNLLHPAFRLKPVESPEWAVRNFRWSDPVGENADLKDFLISEMELLILCWSREFPS
jgi:hypothetical protein